MEIHNNDYAALEQINVTGTIPTSNQNVIVIENPKPVGSCKLNISKRYSFNTGGNTKITTVDKSVDFRGGPQAWKSSKIKSKTKYFRKKRGVWTRGKTTISAGIEGSYNPISYFSDAGDCGLPTTPLNRIKTKKRSKVKFKYTNQDNLFRFEDNIFYGVHKRRSDYTKKADYFDNDVL